jgi:hypothetical protein
MINYVRTLLLNHGRDGHSVQEAGEEYIQEGFIPRQLTAPLRLIRNTLFGSVPDRLFMNYRMRQIMQLMHATELANDISVEDPRITYLPFKQDFFNDVFKAAISRTAGPTWRYTVIGEHVSNMSSGLSRQVWELSILEGGEVVVTKRRGVVETRSHYVITDTPVPLHGSDLQIYLHGAPTGTSLRIESLARPAFDIATVLSSTVAVIEQYGFDEIFPATATEPVATWKRIWLAHPDAAMRFTAVLLAIGYRTSQLPQEMKIV